MLTVSQFTWWEGGRNPWRAAFMCKTLTFAFSSAASGFMRGTFSTGLFHVIVPIWDVQHWYYTMDLRKNFTAVDMKHQETLIRKGTLTIQKLVAICMWKAPASQSCRHLSKKWNICKSVKRGSGINFEASFVVVYSN